VSTLTTKKFCRRSLGNQVESTKLTSGYHGKSGQGVLKGSDAIGLPEGASVVRQKERPGGEGKKVEIRGGLGGGGAVVNIKTSTKNWSQKKKRGGVELVVVIRERVKNVGKAE